MMVVMCGQLNKGVLGLHKFFALHDQLKGGSLVEIMNVVKSLKRNAHVEAKNPEHSGIKSTKNRDIYRWWLTFPWESYKLQVVDIVGGYETSRLRLF